MPNDIVESLKSKLEKNLNHFEEELSSFCVGRAAPMLVENILVEYFGVPTPLKQISNISIPDPKTVAIQPWEKGQLKEIEKAIVDAQTGMTPINDGLIIRLNVPQPTEEGRRDLVKKLHQKLEEARIEVRKFRDDLWKEVKDLEKSGDLTEDDKFDLKDEIQKVVDEANGELKNKSEEKEEEIMKV